MSREAPSFVKARPTLLGLLRRAHLRVVLISVVLIGLCSIAIEVVVVRLYTINNLQLVVRSIGYTVEAAVVFRDRDAAAKALAEISENNSVAEAHLVDLDGNTLASWTRFDDMSAIRTEQAIAALILPQNVVGTITHDGKRIGEIRLVGFGRDLFLLLLFSIGSSVLCFLLSSWAAYCLSRKTGQEIVAPILEITHIAHAARRGGQFSKRAKATDIRELQQLGDDFNALLSDLESWQSQVQAETETLTYMTDHDSLTNLHNRAFFERSLLAAVRGARESGTTFAVFFIDSDHFKEVNDRFGHSVGDEVLRTVGLRLKGQLREADLVARVGGDEFAILISPLRELDDATRIARNIVESMKEPISLMDGKRLQSSLSIGIAIFPDHADDAEELVKCADKAMYLAKKVRGATYRVATKGVSLTTIEG